MRLPKLRELREAVTAVLSPRFTTRFPAEPCVVPERYRGKPRFDPDTCVGCGACVNVCPTSALTMVDEPDGAHPLRRITLRYDTCIFCGNCQDNCTTQTGIQLSNEWDLAGLDRRSMTQTHEHELQRCERCGTSIGTKKHLAWLCERLGPLAYANPSLLLAGSEALSNETLSAAPTQAGEVRTSDFARILCPRCRYELNLWL
ncbi:MAG: 4Fe-4S dicluster domain-containing protein [Planctomycetes bacterium]|nr:4Fe-4S dicluster domain-containing protein [Planctomycetota bacterium]